MGFLYFNSAVSVVGNFEADDFNVTDLRKLETVNSIRVGNEILKHGIDVSSITAKLLK